MMELVRSIDLEPDDWLWATWRQRIPRKLPEPTPFNKAECLETLRSLKERKYSYRRGDGFGFQKIVPASLSREEAHFWFTAMVSYNKKPEEFHHKFYQWLEEVETQSFTGEISLAEVKEAISPHFSPVLSMPLPVLSMPLLSPLSYLFTLEDIVDLMEESNYFLAPWFRKSVLPYLTEERAEELRQYLRTKLKNSQWTLSHSYYRQPSPVFYLAAYLGMHAEIQALVESWPDDLYYQNKTYHYCRFRHQPEEIIFGLGSAGLVETHMRRLKLILYVPEYFRAWLAHTEYTSLDWLFKSILKAKTKEIRKQLLEAFNLVKAPEVSQYMLQLMIKAKAPLATKWLDDNIEYAIAGLLPLTMSHNPLKEAAINYLQRTNRKGYSDFIRDCMAENPVAIPVKVKDLVFNESAKKSCSKAPPKWLQDSLKQIKRGRHKINWVEPSDLPPLTADKYNLKEEQIKLLLIALKKSNLNDPHPLLAELKSHADTNMLDNFAWSLFERWLEVGSPPKDKWALFAVGLLGNDTSVLKLVPMIRGWPKQTLSHYKRAEIGLQCLAAIGTKTALMQINEMARRLRSGLLKKKAKECVEALASCQNLMVEQLEDRIVPDCELDANSSRIFDYGSRKFYLVIGTDMKPIIKDERGKIKRTLPKPGKNDNVEFAEKAIAEYQFLKKQLTEVIKAQSKRLERAMINERTWSPQAFESFFVQHPLMVSFARSLLWAGYDNSGQLILTFRLTEDNTYANIEDETCNLENLARVGIAHPAELSETQRLTWIELLSDYEIMPPFEQLNRQVFGLEPEEIESKEITRYQKIIVYPPKMLLGILEVTGWQGDTIYYKSFDRANITAIVEIGNCISSSIDEADRIKRCFFVLGTYPNAYLDYERAIKLKDVDAVVMSEVLRDLRAIASKGSQDPPF